MLGQEFTTTDNYADSETDIDREVTIHVSASEPVFCQIARINPKDGSRIWEIADTPLPAIDISFENCAGVRFKTKDGTPADVYTVWTFPIDDVLIRRFSSNGPFGSGGSGSSQIHGPFTVTVAQSIALAAAGVPIYVPTVGDILLDAWVEVPIAWDGVTPLADIGNFLGGNNFGWFNVNNPIDISAASAPINANDELVSYAQPGSGKGPDMLLLSGGTVTPGRFIGAAPIRVVVSQSGQLGGLPVAGTTGELNVYLHIGTPV